MTVLLLAGPAAALGSAPAQAATGQCVGNRIEHLAVKTSGSLSCGSIQIANAKYAGPVKVYGKGRCIAASAVIDAGRNEAVKVTPSYHC
ncbi:hypothetical protein ACIBHY_12945 [Nonomuraea sp. NPDC050547]|uniref:hypothetical protein n=1 Tax=unclassified Nonomuraea TaxID=2593643 RepID=UPI0037A2D91A